MSVRRRWVLRTVALVGALLVGGTAWRGRASWLLVHASLANLQPHADERELVFVGDIMLSRNVARSLRSAGRPPEAHFAPTRALIRRADFASGNLECPVSVGTEPLPDKKFVFNADPSMVPALEDAGFDLLSLANNHILDHGLDALDQALALFDDSAVGHVGVSTKGEHQTPHIVDLDGISVGTLAHCDPKGPSSCARAFDAFDRGPAKVSFPLARADLEALRDRVDIVAGHHPHVQQPAEWLDGGLVLYSMGNFGFDQHFPNTQDSRLYSVVVGKEGVRRARYLPLVLKPGDWAPTAVVDAFVPVPSLEKRLRTQLDLW